MTSITVQTRENEMEKLMVQHKEMSSLVRDLKEQVEGLGEETRGLRDLLTSRAASE
jgi:hypothetical protein